MEASSRQPCNTGYRRETSNYRKSGSTSTTDAPQGQRRACTSGMLQFGLPWPRALSTSDLPPTQPPNCELGTHPKFADLYKQYGVKDPVQKLADRQSNRVKRLEQRSRTAHPDDVSTDHAALEQARQKLAQYQDLLARQPPMVGASECPCPHCDQIFETPMGLCSAP